MLWNRDDLYLGSWNMLLTFNVYSMSVNLGPIAPGSPSLKVPANPQRDGFGYNPSEFPPRIPLPVEIKNSFSITTKHLSISPH